MRGSITFVLTHPNDTVLDAIRGVLDWTTTNYAERDGDFFDRFDTLEARVNELEKERDELRSEIDNQEE